MFAWAWIRPSSSVVDVPVRVGLSKGFDSATTTSGSSSTADSVRTKLAPSVRPSVRLMPVRCSTR
jgi:hypothetical protein